MAIIHRGDFNSFRASVVDPTSDQGKVGVQPFSVLQEVRKGKGDRRIQFDTSKESRGLAIKSLMLDPGFDSFLERVFSPKHQILLLAWTYDLSGAAVTLCPRVGIGPETCLIPLKAGGMRRFLGSGLLLRPAQPVVGGLTVRIQICESDSDLRKFGEVLSIVATKVQGSALNQTLAQLAGTAGVTFATLAAVQESALELAKLIGGILKSNDDNFVDFYEGYFSASERWAPTEEEYAGFASQIVLSRLK